MSDDNSDEDSTEEKSAADILKERLPDDGELATKEDLDGVQEDAVKAVQDSLPDGNLATVQAMKSIVKDEVASQIESVLERDEDARKSVRELYAEAEDAEEFEAAFKQEYGSADADVDVPNASGEGSSPADSMSQEVDGPDQAGDSYPEAAADDEGNTTGGSDAPNQGNESMDDRGVSTTSDKSDGGDQDVNKQDDEMGGEMGSMGDDEPSMQPPHPDDYQTKEAWQADYDAWSSEFEEYATEEAEDLDEGDDDGGSEEEKSVGEETKAAAQKLAQKYDLSVDEVLEMMGGDYEDDDEEEDDEMEMAEDDYEDDEMMPDEEQDDEGDMMSVLEESLPADVFEVVREYVGGGEMAREDARKIARALDDSDEEDSEEDLEKTVADVLQGGAEVQGGTAIPTDPNDSQVDKQYSASDEGGDGETQASPALSNFYG